MKSGRFGPYVELGSIRATIPKSMDPDAITLEEAIKLIEAKKARGPGRTRAKKRPNLLRAKRRHGRNQHHVRHPDPWKMIRMMPMTCPMMTA